MSRTVPSFAEEGLKRFLHGMDRRIKDLERGGDWQFDDEMEPEEIVLAGGQPQLLAMAASSDSIASGGDYVTFDSVLAVQGFGSVLTAGSSWTHPVAGVYMLTYEHVWDSYADGGTIELEIDGVVGADGIIGDGVNGTNGQGTIAYVTEAGTVGKIKVTQSSGSAQTCTAVVRIALPDPQASLSADTLLETMWVDHRTSGATSSTVLASGVPYRVVVTGNHNGDFDAAAIYGTPDALMFPSTGQPDGEAIADAEMTYASTAPGTFPVHGTGFTFNAGSGAAHIEPVGGQPSTVDAGHQYVYEITGQGSTLTASIADAIRSDNNGMLRVDIYGPVG